MARSIVHQEYTLGEKKYTLGKGSHTRKQESLAPLKSTSALWEMFNSQHQCCFRGQGLSDLQTSMS